MKRTLRYVYLSLCLAILTFNLYFPGINTGRAEAVNGDVDGEIDGTAAAQQDGDPTPPTIEIMYGGGADLINPGHWGVSVVDLESGLAEVRITEDGLVLIHDRNLAGIPGRAYLVPVPWEHGVHTITVFARNGEHASSSKTDEVDIAPPLPDRPHGIVAIADPPATYVGEVVEFTAGGYEDVVSIEWIFGDGTTVSEEFEPTHVYSHTGTFFVELYVTQVIMVTDGEDPRYDIVSDHTFTFVYILPRPNVPPVADAGVDVGGVAGVPVQFDGSGSYDPDGTIVACVWDFGDGTTATGTLTPIHTYSSLGVYTVTLTVTDDDGGVGSDTLTVTVGDVNGEIDELKEMIQDSEDDCWRRPARNRKRAINSKLTVLQGLISNEDFDEAYDKLLHDIKPKLTGLKTDENEEPWGNGVFRQAWVTCPELSEDFRLKCNEILSLIKELSQPPPPVDDDVEPPVIVLTPASMDIYDAEAVGGILVEWEITDASGIAQATVLLNGEVIASYGVSDSISDSYLLPNIPGTYTIDITARDNDNDPWHHDGVDWLESSAQTTITIIDDDTEAPDITIIYDGDGTTEDPGVWNVYVEDIGSGLAEVKISIDGDEMVYDQQLGGIREKSYIIPVPGLVGVHTIEVFAKDNDNDWPGDQLEITITEEVDIAPPIIIG